ncbi:MAG: (d)CMP kinase [Clostridia bacterium]|nr:(d)CMP kinase [Clostridia bacterium]
MINIAIDGPSGAGKSTIAKAIAQKLNITYLDTGAMYRAVALYAVENGKDVSNADEIAPLLNEINLSFVKKDNGHVICLNGRDVSEDIRRHEMSKCASEVSKLPQVREFLVAMQREIAAENDVVLDGRDITSNVLPNTKYKFYLTATAEERAKRRCLELKQKGQEVEYEKILKDIIDRDNNDMTRQFAPLVKTDDSIEIDSSELNQEQVAELILSHVETISKSEGAGAAIVARDNQNSSVKVADKKKTKRNPFIRAFANFVKWVMGGLWYTKIYFKDKFIKNSKAIVICNHYSALDPCVIISKLLGKNGKIMMKEEVSANGFIASVAQELGCIPVKRGEADMKAVKRVLNALNHNQQVLIFPEGTRNKNENFKEMLPFKAGVATFALKSKAPIVPLMYYKKTGAFKKNRLIVGDPFWLDEFYGEKLGVVKEAATEYIYNKMLDLRKEVDLLVEKCKGSKKKYLKYKRLQSKELYENANNRS